MMIHRSVDRLDDSFQSRPWRRPARSKAISDWNNRLGTLFDSEHPSALNYKLPSILLATVETNYMLPDPAHFKTQNWPPLENSAADSQIESAIWSVSSSMRRMLSGLEQRRDGNSGQFTASDTLPIALLKRTTKSRTVFQTSMHGYIIRLQHQWR
jgi:hypothetical protein